MSKMENNRAIINDIMKTFISIIKNIRDFGFKSDIFQKILDKLNYISFNSEKYDLYKNLIIDIINSLPSEKEPYEFDYDIWDSMYEKMNKRKRVMRNSSPFNYNNITSKMGHIWNGILSLNHELKSN